MDNVDLRLIKPYSKYSDFYKKNVFVIPCNVIEILDRLPNNKFTIKIQIVNFYTGQKEEKVAITYARTIQIFKDLQKEFPFRTTADIIMTKRGICYVVYGVFNTGFEELWFDVEEILNYDEAQILNVFNSHYKDLSEWVKRNLPNQEIDEEYNDLPF